MRQVEEALARQVIYGGDLATNLLEVARVDEERLSLLIAESMSLPAALTGELPIAQGSVRALVPPEMAVARAVVPVAREGDRLVLAVAEPLPREVAEQLGIRAGAGHRPARGGRGARSPGHRAGLRRAPRAPHAAPGGAPRGRGRSGPGSMPPPLGAAPKVPEAPRPPSAPPPRNTSRSFPAARAAGPHALDRPGASQLRPALAEGHDSAPPSAALRGEHRVGLLQREPTASARPPRRRRGPITLDQAKEEAEEAADRDALLDLYFDFSRQFFDYAALFLVHGDIAEGRDAFGTGASREKVVGIGVPLDLPGVMSSARDKRAAVMTRVADGRSRRRADDGPAALARRPRSRSSRSSCARAPWRCCTATAASTASTARACTRSRTSPASSARRSSASSCAASSRGSSPAAAARWRAAVRAWSRPEEVGAASGSGAGDGARGGDVARASAGLPHVRRRSRRGRRPFRRARLPSAPAVLRARRRRIRAPRRRARPHRSCARRARPIPREEPALRRPSRWAAARVGALRRASSRERSRRASSCERSRRASSRERAAARRAAHADASAPGLGPAVEMVTTTTRARSSTSSGGKRSRPTRARRRRRPSRSLRTRPPTGTASASRCPRSSSTIEDDCGARGKASPASPTRRPKGELLRQGEQAMRVIMARFPGPVSFERARIATVANPPRASDCGPLLRLVARQRKVALPFVLEKLGEADAEMRGWATHLLGELPYVEALPDLLGAPAGRGPRDAGVGGALDRRRGAQLADDVVGGIHELARARRPQRAHRGDARDGRAARPGARARARPRPGRRRRGRGRGGARGPRAGDAAGLRRRRAQMVRNGGTSTPRATASNGSSTP